MPELPEVESLAGFLRERAVGRAFVRADITAISALKTYDPPVSALVGPADRRRPAAREVPRLLGPGRAPGHPPGPRRLAALARRAVDRAGPARQGPDRAPDGLDDGSGFDLTEAGTQKKLAVYVVRDPAEVPGIARLGPEPFSLLDRGVRRDPKQAGRVQLKGVLRNQSVIAGIGNAYSDEILHVAKMSPFKPASNLTDDELQTLYDAMRETLQDAVDRSTGLAAQDLKSEKKSRPAGARPDRPEVPGLR